MASRAVRDDPLAASATGVSVLWTRMVTFALGGAIVGAGGSIQAHYILIINPQELGFFISLTFIIFLLVGGLQSLWGPVLAAVVLTALPELTRFASEYRLILYGLVIVLVVLFRPDGLLTRTPTGQRNRLDALFGRETPRRPPGQEPPRGPNDAPQPAGPEPPDLTGLCCGRRRSRKAEPSLRSSVRSKNGWFPAESQTPNETTSPEKRS